jgi:hypothetical protein
VETASLITFIKNYKITNTESYESIKLGIDAHAKWYYVARQLDGATPKKVGEAAHAFIAGGDEFPGDGEDGVFGGLGVAAELVEVDGKP